jgi:hypothetical protein
MMRLGAFWRACLRWGFRSQNPVRLIVQSDDMFVYGVQVDLMGRRGPGGDCRVHRVVAPEPEAYCSSQDALGTPR